MKIDRKLLNSAVRSVPLQVTLEGRKIDVTDLTVHWPLFNAIYADVEYVAKDRYGRPVLDDNKELVRKRGQFLVRRIKVTGERREVREVDLGGDHNEFLANQQRKEKLLEPEGDA